MSPEVETWIKSGRKAAAELPALRPNHLRFVQVRGLVQSVLTHPDYGKPPTFFRVQRYEVHEGFVDEYASLENLRDYVIEDVEWDAVEDTVQRLAGAVVELSTNVDALY